MDVLRSLWKDKPLLITVAVGLAVLLFILYKSNKSTVTAPDGTVATTPTTGGGGTYVEESFNFYSPTSTTTTTTYAGVPTQTPVTPPTASAMPVSYLLKWTQQYTFKRGEDLDGLAKTLAAMLQKSGATGTVTWMDLYNFNKARLDDLGRDYKYKGPIYELKMHGGETITVPQWVQS